MASNRAADSSTRLLALIQLDQEDAIRWNGWAIKCGSLTFVAWEDNHFRLSHGLDALFAHEIEPTYQGLAQGWEWDSRSWKRVHLLDYVVQYRGPYQVGVIRPPDERQSDLTIRLRSQGREVFTWRGNANSAFLVREETLYYTEFSPIATGMALVAHDLAHDEQLWRSDLTGLGRRDILATGTGAQPFAYATTSSKLSEKKASAATSSSSTATRERPSVTRCSWMSTET